MTQAKMEGGVGFNGTPGWEGAQEGQEPVETGRMSES